MRTPTDIRDAFETFADRAPSEVTLLLDDPAPTRHRGWRPVAAAVVAVAAVVALVAALAVTFAPHRRATPAGVPPARVPMRFSFTIDPAAGYEFIFSHIQASMQGATFKDGSDEGTVHVYEPGAFGRAEAMKGTKIHVNGHDGYFADRGSISGNSIAWQYAPDAWAVVMEKDYAPAAKALSAELAFAKALRFTARPLQVPFKMGYLPPGLALTSGSEQSGSLPAVRQLSFSNAARDDVLRATFVPGGQCFGGTRVVVHGYRGCLGRPEDATDGQRALRLLIPGGSLTVDRFSSDYSDAELRKIAESITLATIGQPATWFDADAAVPH